jgi:FAD/FMN-containing dehydrogenase
MSNVQPELLEQFRKRITGTVVVPGEEGYEQDCLPWNLAYEQFPAVIVWPKSVTDIVEAIHFAKKHRLGVAVQGTGHGIALPANECMLIKTSRMANISIDPITKTARVQAGALWGEVLKEA